MSILFNVIYKVKVTSIKMPGNPLKIQWLGRKCSHCWGQGSFPGQGTKIPRAVQLSSVTQSCRTLFDPMDCSTPGFPVLPHPTELAQTHVHRVSDAIQPSCLLSSPSPSILNLSQHQGLFKRVSSSHQVAKVLESQFQNQSFQWTSKTDLL